jgi:hypothetical protein
MEGKRMPKFIVEQYETHVLRYAVEAEDKAEAIKKVMGGHGKQQGEQTFLALNEDIGMSLEKGFSDKELAELNAASLIGWSPGDESFVFSIRSVEEVK